MFIFFFSPSKILKPFVTLTNAIVKTVASTYVSTIKIESLPLWKGEATIDDIEINTEGINQILRNSKSRLTLEKIATSRLKAKLPILTPGTNPISISVHSLELALAIKERTEPKPEKPKPATNPEQDSQKPQKQNFITKLTSNIEIKIDGLSISLNIKGVQLNLIGSSVYVHVINGQTIVQLSKIRAFIKYNNISITLTIENVDISASEENTEIAVSGFTVTVSVPDFFDLIKDLSLKIHILPNNEIHVKSLSQVRIGVNLSLLPPLFEVIALFMKPPEPKFSPLPKLTIHVDGIFFAAYVSSTLGIELSISKLKLKNNVFELRPLEMRLLIRDGVIPILEPSIIIGKLLQTDRTIKVSAEIEMLKLAIPVSKDLVDQLTKINIKIPPLPTFPPPPPPKIPEISMKLMNCPKVSTTGKLINFEFPYDVIPTGFSFGGLFTNGDKIMLRVWDASSATMIAFSSFEISRLSDEFSMDNQQMIPLYKFQLVLPKETSNYPDILDKIKFTCLSSVVLSEALDLDVKIGNILITADSLELPTGALSLTSIHAHAVIGPVMSTRLHASFGISVLLSNLRNQTMCSIFDIPTIHASLSVMSKIDGYLPDGMTRHRFASILQTQIGADTISASLKIPSISLNVVPSIISDVARFAIALDVAKAIAYTVVNKSDTPFVFHVSNSTELTEILPGQTKVVTFTQKQVHFLNFPTISLIVMLNQPGFYNISNSNYISCEIVAPFSFKVSILSSTVFRNFLMAPIEIKLSDPSIATPITKQIGIDDFATSSLFLDKTFHLSLSMTGITEMSKPILLNPLHDTGTKFIVCEVLNQLPSLYLCAPQFCAWLVYREFEVDCLNSAVKHRVQEYSLLPVLVVNNRLPDHIVTSAGVVPPNSSKYISQLTDQSIVFDNGTSIKVGFPLARGLKHRLMIMGKASVIETVPETNTIVISPSFMFYNGAAFPLYFKVVEMKAVLVEPDKTLVLDSTKMPRAVFVGFKFKGKTFWSKGVPVPSRRDLTIKTDSGNLLLIIDVQDDKASVYPKYVAINESSDSIFLNSSTELTPETQAQLLLWRGNKHLVSFSLSSDKGFLSDPVDLDGNEYLIRVFSGSFPSFSSSTYITYSVQSNTDPHTIVFHTDNSPPLTIDNQSPLSFDVTSPSFKNSLRVPAESVCLGKDVPIFLVFSRTGADPFVVNLQSAMESTFVSGMAKLYGRVEISGTQSRVTLSQIPLIPPQIKPKINFSVFLADVKIRIYNDISVPGIPTELLCITASPLSIEGVFQQGGTTTISLVLDTLQIDSLSCHENFPVIFGKVDDKNPLLNLNLKLGSTLNGGIFVDVFHLSISPTQMNIEESLIRFILSLIKLLPQQEIPIKQDTNKILFPTFVRVLHVDQTEFRLSLSTQSFIHAMFKDVPIQLSMLHMENTETFGVQIVESIVAHYISDIIVAVPAALTSLSLIGSPSALVTQSITGLNEFVKSFKQQGSFVGGLKHGSVSLVRSISIGALESIVSFSSSLASTLGQISPVQTQNDTQNDDIGRRIQQMVEFPVEGFQNEGVLGVLKGAGKAMIALVTGPTAAIFSLIGKAGNALLQQVGAASLQTNDRRIEKEAKDLPAIVFE
ncbi:hypothetical protein TVAG_159350 [Trichomonas vaginalis G3]|uniref:Chorein N-terminal domain-containing protein n=1 Tax=Trichomonas vaginalis (strain ATCC PRA-98 / G3) TaxID=412133 RepID=A2F590_TRIV3|nr:regulation of parkin-mediated stimulation of mitophagy in response to mitochondrial depolarization [Trichomonas vaginalis G3]EAX99915.1 hypothetical protein TVAG_159350 [Trichomonas vaginalis G3]KAI5547804.1 regulation of parkin-mediated stimulation of mitophagy in response to mitochondrial depolarization [Trichomonas vaginalis G3]|eukprot:XP_001312845.1 hypothetical protein [Trichomonas vaginalis G3]